MMRAYIIATLILIAAAAVGAILIAAFVAATIQSVHAA